MPDGEPLTRVHGFPLRVLMPGIYGMKTPKWLTRIELVDKHHLGYWEWMGWSDTGERQLQSVIDDPHDAQQIAGQSFVITGWAVANETGVAKVEISTDGGATWNPCTDFQQPDAVASLGVLALRVGGESTATASTEIQVTAPPTPAG